MPIIQQGSINTNAIVVPDLYVQIVPPQNLVLNGAPTNILGIVGTATWGPVGQPATVGSMSAYVAAFGNPQPRKYDMGTQVATAVLQGASNFRCVRATDGTDTAATAAILTNCMTATGLYTGTLGNSVSISFTRGTAANSFKAIVALPGLTAEAYDNIQGAGAPWVATTAYKAGQTVTNGVNTYVCIVGGISASSTGPAGTGNAITDGTVTWNFQNALGPATTAGTFWANVVNAINQGTGPQRGASGLIVATGGAGTVAPPISGGAAWAALTAYKVGQYVTNGGASYLCTVAGTSGTLASGGPLGTTPAADGTVTWVYQVTAYTLTGGTDGVATLNAGVLVGLDVAPRKGMYALRGQGVSVALLADADDSTQWTTQAAYGLSEGTYMICVGPSGDNITNAVATKQGAGLDSYAVKLMFGDWIWWFDSWAGYVRLVSPQGFAAGRLANLSPEQSSLNKQLYGIVGSQKSTAPNVTAAATYAAADLQQLFGANIDVIANPIPAGPQWGVRLGHNSSSNPAISGDNYTRLTNYIAASLNGPGAMGTYVGAVVNLTLFQRIKASLLTFLQNMQGQGQLGSIDGSTPFGVICDITNNPVSRTSLGYVQADVQVQYQAINEKFIVNMEGGVTVSVRRATTQSGQVVN